MNCIPTSRRPVVSTRKAKRICKVAIATAAILSGPIYAQNINWDAEAGDLLWTSPNNWAGNVLPGVNNTAVFNVNATTTISLNNTNQEVAGLLFTQGSAYTLTTGSLTLNNASQTGNVSNVVQVAITTKNIGADLLTSNVTQNTLQLQQQVTSGGIVKTGNGTLRLGTSGTSFDNAINGNILINGGTFQASAGNTAGVNNPLGGTGNVTIGAANVTLSLNHSNLAAAGSAGTYDFVRDIVANNNSFTLNVLRAAGSANAGVSQAGMLTIGNATMNVTGDNAFQARLDGVNILSGATTTLNVNNNGSNAGGNHLRIDSLTGDATTTLQKNGGQTLFISATTPGFSGNVIVNGGGTTQVESTAAGNAFTNAQTLTFNIGSTLNLRGEDSSDYGVAIKFGAGVISSTISADRIAAGATRTMSLGDVNASGATLTLTSGNNYGYALDSITVNAGATSTLNVTINGSGVVTSSLLNLPATSTLNKIGGSTLVLDGNQSATAAGAINIRTGSINAIAAGSLGTGLVTVGNATPNTAGFFNDFSRLNWNAAGASANSSGADAVAVAGGVIDLNVVPVATDVFDIQVNGRIQGNGAQLQGLTVGTNVTLAPNSIVIHEQPGAATATIAGLANNAEVFYGLGANTNSLPVIGAGTPWRGISGDNTAGRTIQGASAGAPTLININGGDNDPATIEATLQAMSDQSLNFGTTAAGDGGYTWTSTAAGGEKVTLAIRGALGTSALGLVPGGRVIFAETGAATGLAAAVDKIVVQNGALALVVNQALNGVPVEVLNGGSLDIGGTTPTAIDGNANIKSGGVLFLTDNLLLTGTGALTIETGGKLDITGSAPADILTASSQEISFTGTGNTVRFAASNVEELDLRVPDANVTYVVGGGVATTGNFPETTINAPSLNTQTDGLSLQNGTLTNDGTTRAFTGPITLTDSNLTIAASRNTAFIITGDVQTTGDIQIGSLTAIDGRDKSSNAAAVNSLGVADPYNSAAQVILMGAFSANNVTVNNSHLALGNANTTIAGDLTVNGGVFYADGGGPIAAGANAGQLTSKLAAGTLANRIILGPNTRTEMKLDLLSDANATVLNVNQAIVIDGDINPLDNRRMWVSRNSGTNNRVNLNNVTLRDGSVFGVQEDNTDVRASLKLAGNATVSTPNSNSNIDYLNITRDASLPAFDGTNFAVLTQGRLNMAGWQTSNVTNSNVFGTIGEGVQVDLVRGQLFFLPGSALNGVVRTQTAAVGGDSFVVSSSNNSTSDTSIGGTGRIELGRSGAANGPEDFEIRGTEIATGVAPLHTHTGEIRVVNDGNDTTVDGIVRSSRSNDAAVAARVQVDNVVLASGSTVQLASANAIPLAVSSISLQGNGTIDTASTGITVNTVNAGANAVTFTGTQSPTLINPITAGQVNVNNTRLTIPGNLDSTLSVNGNATASLSGNVTGGLNVTTGTASFDAGGATKSVTGPVSLDAGNIAVTNGTLDFGNTVIASTASQLVAGLREARTPGAFDITTQNLSNVVKLGPVMAQSTTGWGSNETYSYTGQFFVPDNNGNGTGSFAFAENFDDSVRVVIDGTQRLSNSVFNDATGTGELTLPTGWHEVEFRFGQGGGGAGPVNSDGWTGAPGFGLDLDNSNGIDNSTTSPVQAQYVAPLDNGLMNLFRTTISSNLSIGTDSTIRAGGLTNIGRIIFGGFNAQLSLNLASGAAVQSSASTIEIGTGGSGRVDVARAGDKLTVGSLSLNGDLTVAGQGDVTVTGDSEGIGFITKEGSGDLIINGTVEGSVSVNGGALGGNGTFIGGIALNGGTIAPGLSPGLLTASTLTAVSTSTFEFEIGSGLVGVDFDQISITGDSLDIGGAGLTLTVSSALQTNDVLTLILNNGTDVDPGVFGGFTNGSFINLPAGYQLQISYFDDAAQAGLQLAGGNDVSVLVTVPEPSAAVALFGSLATLAGMRRFRRRNS